MYKAVISVRLQSCTHLNLMDLTFWVDMLRLVLLNPSSRVLPSLPHKFFKVSSQQTFLLACSQITVLAICGTSVSWNSIFLFLIVDEIVCLIIDWRAVNQKKMLLSILVPLNQLYLQKSAGETFHSMEINIPCYQAGHFAVKDTGAAKKLATLVIFFRLQAIRGIIRYYVSPYFHNCCFRNY